MKRKTFKKGQYVRVLHRNYPYIGRYVKRDTETTDSHYVQFAANWHWCKEKYIFPVEGVKGN